MKEKNEQKKLVDLNCDFGEGFGIYTFGQDEQLLRYVSSVNIACGFHAGDPHTMRAAIEQAAAAGVAVGAHPGLPDRLGFGRREIAASADEVYDYLLYQLGALSAFAKASGVSVRHVKAHGALYHMANRDSAIADAIIRAVIVCDPDLLIYAQYGGRLLAQAREAGLGVVSEVFADRTYNLDGMLTPRSEPGATLHGTDQVLDQAIRMVLQGTAATIQGGEVQVQADTICLHGDGPQAAALAAAIHEGLSAAGIAVCSPSR